ncbi:pyrimidine utilization regulatory protein R [compost metagenome]
MLLGASRIPAHLRDALEAETQRHLALLQDWMHRGLIAPVEVSHLLLAISAATRTHECFDLQMAGITGKDRPDDADYESAIATAVRLVVGGAAANMSGGAKGIATADQ